MISCNTIEYKPKYSDFANAWEKDNLIGKVKTLEHYKAKVTDFNTGEIEKSRIDFRKVYTEFGKIAYQERFDNIGKSEQYIKNTYDKNSNQIESISEDFITPSKSIGKAEFDKTGKTISTSIILNDSLNYKVLFEYDNHGNLIIQRNIQNNDTSLIRIEYKYKEDGKILLKKQIGNSEYGKNEYTNEFKYDQFGNLVELIYKSEFQGQIKSTYEYDSKNRIVKIAEYQNGQIEKETFFDKYYNQISIKYYVKAALNKEMKYEYDFDSKGNWIEKKVSVKEYYGKENTFLPIIVETRKIEYYE